MGVVSSKITHFQRKSQPKRAQEEGARYEDVGQQGFIFNRYHFRWLCVEEVYFFNFFLGGGCLLI